MINVSKSGYIHKKIFPNASLRDFIYFSDIYVDINHFYLYINIFIFYTESILKGTEFSKLNFQI